MGMTPERLADLKESSEVNTRLFHPEVIRELIAEVECLQQALEMAGRIIEKVPTVECESMWQEAEIWLERYWLSDVKRP